MNKYVPYLLAALAPLCWAFDIVLARGMSVSSPPFGLVFWRWTIALIIMLPIFFTTVKQDWPEIKKSWGILSVLSVLGVSGFIALLYIGVKHTSAINSSIIQCLIPAIIVFLVYVLTGDKPKISQMAGMALCFFGASYVAFQGSWINVKSLSFVHGDMLVLIAAIMYGLYSVLLPKSPKIHPVSFLVSVSALGVITILPFYIWEIYTIGCMAITPKTIAVLVSMAIFPAIVAYLCWIKSVTMIGASKTGIFTTLTPVFTAVLSYTFLKEPLLSFHLVGMLMIFSGMLLFNGSEFFKANT